MSNKKNRLSEEPSLYLRQHGGNPVNWYPWGEEALQKAAASDRLLLISIGYSSCHWCHVMERESFENEEVAGVMNENFVCIKVDREERPDIDNMYMTAVQLMTGSGGWPLNCIALPDGRPVWGGTYFRTERWIEILVTVARYYRENREATIKHAEELTKGVVAASVVAEPAPGRYTMTDLRSAVQRLAGSFDVVNGGTGGAPRFPMPSLWEFLMQYGFVTGDQRVSDHVEKTLTQIVTGGMYDQAGGGFARYSVDKEWVVPHFEKMLYDNAQLIGLYADAWLRYGNPRFREVVLQTSAFLRDEMLSPDGTLASSIDADSEGEEGRFYVWTPAEICELNIAEPDLFRRYYGIDTAPLWEGKYHILRAPADEQSFCSREGIDAGRFPELKRNWKGILMDARSFRVRPVTDTKAITAWNAMAVTGLVKAYNATGEEWLIKLAVSIAESIIKTGRSADGRLLRICGEDAGLRAIPGFLDDYAFFIQAMLSLYEASMDYRWLQEAGRALREAKESFFSDSEGLFRFARTGSDPAIAGSFETYDSVVPSSNAVMATNIFLISRLYGDTALEAMAGAMVERMADKVTRHPSAYSAWARLMVLTGYPFHEVAVTGPWASHILKEIMAEYLPGKVVAASAGVSPVPLLQGRDVPGKTLIYVCTGNTCDLPVESSGAAIEKIKNRAGLS